MEFLHKEYERLLGDLFNEGNNIFEIDLSFSKNSHDIFVEFNNKLKIPYSVSNWDALDECLLDLKWIGSEKYALIIKNVKNFLQKNEKDMKILIYLLSYAEKEWAKRNVVFEVIIFEEDANIINRISDLLKKINKDSEV